MNERLTTLASGLITHPPAPMRDNRGLRTPPPPLPTVTGPTRRHGGRAPEKKVTPRPSARPSSALHVPTPFGYLGDIVACSLSRFPLLRYRLFAYFLRTK